jgi:hypothetical protein
MIGVSPHIIEVHAVEFGVNIHTDMPPDLILARFIFFKQKGFERQTKFKGSNRGYIQRCTLSNYQLKAYNKGLQYNLNENILRYEIKVTKMQFFKNKISGIQYLNDLLDNKILSQLGGILQQFWSYVVLKEEVFHFARLIRRWQPISANYFRHLESSFAFTTSISRKPSHTRR